MDKPRSKAADFALLSHDELLSLSGGMQWPIGFAITSEMMANVMNGVMVEGGWASWHA